MRIVFVIINTGVGCVNQCVDGCAAPIRRPSAVGRKSRTIPGEAKTDRFGCRRWRRLPSTSRTKPRRQVTPGAARMARLDPVSGPVGSTVTPRWYSFLLNQSQHHSPYVAMQIIEAETVGELLYSQPDECGNLGVQALPRPSSSRISHLSRDSWNSTALDHYSQPSSHTGRLYWRTIVPVPQHGTRIPIRLRWGGGSRSCSNSGQSLSGQRCGKRAFGLLVR